MKELLLKILNDPRSVVALCAVIISIISLFLAIYSAFQTRKNNRLSKLPIGYILPYDGEEEIHVTLQNNGTGPLITTSINFLNSSGEAKKSLVEWMPELGSNYQWTTFSEAKKIVLKPSDTKILLKLNGDKADPEFAKIRDEIRLALKDITVDIKYKSVFNERKNKHLLFKLKWFSRKKYINQIND